MAREPDGSEPPCRQLRRPLIAELFQGTDSLLLDLDPSLREPPDLRTGQTASREPFLVPADSLVPRKPAWDPPSESLSDRTLLLPRLG